MRDPRLELRASERHNRATADELAKAYEHGRMLGEGAPDPSVLRNLDAVIGNRAGMWGAFHDSFVTAARATPERQAAWSSALAAALSTERDALSGRGTREDDVLQGAAQAWADEHDPFSVWGRHSVHVPVHRENLWHWGQLLLRIDPAAGLQALDAIPIPALADEILTLFMRDDREQIEALIDAAPAVFDVVTGEWLASRSTAALQVVDLVIQHVRELHNVVSRTARNGDEKAAEVLQQLTTVELPAWMKRAFARVLSRPDGLPIALGYLAHLAARTLGQQQTDWNADGAAFASLAAVLSERCVTVANVREAWLRRDGAVQKDPARVRVTGRTTAQKSKTEGEGAQTIRAAGFPLLWGALTMLGEDPPEESIDALWAWFLELLRGRDDGLTSLSYNDGERYASEVIGNMCSRLPDADSQIRAAYVTLEPQRRRTLFTFNYEDTNSDLASVLLLRVALRIAVALAPRENDKSSGHALFYWTYAAALRLWMTAVLDSSKAKRQLVLACFAAMPHIFGDALEKAVKKTFPSLVPDPLMLVSACQNLWRNGADAAHLQAFVAQAGADLPATLRDAYEWAQLTGRDIDFPDSLMQFASLLNVQLASADKEV